MWDALLRMFIDGYPKDKPGPYPNFPKDSELIGNFLGAKKFDELLEKFFNEEIINKTFAKEMVNKFFMEIHKKAELISKCVPSLVSANIQIKTIQIQE